MGEVQVFISSSMNWGKPPTHPPGLARADESKGAAGVAGQGEQVRGAPRQRCPGKKAGHR